MFFRELNDSKNEVFSKSFIYAAEFNYVAVSSNKDTETMAAISVDFSAHHFYKFTFEKLFIFLFKKKCYRADRHSRKRMDPSAGIIHI